VNVPFGIRLSLRQGTVYYMADRHLSSSLPHYFIVLNAEPLSDSILLLSVVTSKIDNVHRRRKNEAPRGKPLRSSAQTLLRKDGVSSPFRFA